MNKDDHTIMELFKGINKMNKILVDVSGSVLTRKVLKNNTVAGVPAKIIKEGLCAT